MAGAFRWGWAGAGCPGPCGSGGGQCARRRMRPHPGRALPRARGRRLGVNRAAVELHVAAGANDLVRSAALVHDLGCAGDRGGVERAGVVGNGGVAGVGGGGGCGVHVRCSPRATVPSNRTRPACRAPRSGPAQTLCASTGSARPAAIVAIRAHGSRSPTMVVLSNLLGTRW